MRAMRYAGRMQGDHATGNMFSAHKFTIHVVQYFIAVDIAVIIRSGNGIRVIIV
jgi:hypothetical protein